ncbi:MAG: gamma carbonic anhydrase family protein [Rectinemataceae bacterium]|nr:gamma carbonic anhydrase family protein [Rectinemataceae bacterium]
MKDNNQGMPGPSYIAPSASITGDVTVGQDSSVWHNTTLRGDMAPISIGDRTNIQDGAVLHVADDLPCIIGDDVTVGHGAIVHGCKVGNRCLIGMGSIILNGAEIGDECVVGAGALITEGKKIPRRSLIVGSPAKVIRDIRDDELVKILGNASEYVRLAKNAGASDKK